MHHHNFGCWLQMIFASKAGGSPQHFRQMYVKKVNLLGLISLLTLPEEATPPPVQAAWPQLMAGTMRLLTTLKEQQVRLSLHVSSVSRHLAPLARSHSHFSGSGMYPFIHFPCCM